MKTIRCYSIAVIYITFMLISINVNSQNQNINTMVDNIHWLGQSAIKIIAKEKTIYIDPYRIKENDQADIVLITHCHGDHLSPEDIEKVITGNSRIIAPENCMGKIKGLKVSEIQSLVPGEYTDMEGIKINAVPAYNVVKTNFHPKSNKWVGYVVDIGGVKIYHAGDTERVPEMKDIDCDIALLPLGQTYTMNSVEEAANAAIDVKARIAIPIHYGPNEGKESDAETFRELLKGKVEVVIKPRE